MGKPRATQQNAAELKEFNFAAVQEAAAAAPQEGAAMDAMSIADALVAKGKAGLYDLKVLGATSTLHPSNPLVAQVTLRVENQVPVNVPVLNAVGTPKKSADGHTYYTVAAGNRITVSSYNLAAALRAIAPELAGAISANPMQAAPLLLAGATVKACCIAAPAGHLFSNPFSTSDKGFMPPTNRVVWNCLSVIKLADNVNRRREQAVDALFNSLLFQRQQRVTATPAAAAAETAATPAAETAAF